jgi:HEAT repeat protein
VIIFALKLAKIYNQLEAKNEIIQLLHHRNKKVRLDAIDALSYLNVLEAKEILKTDLEKRSQEEQIAVFKMMENLYESDDESFIMKYINHDLFEIKIMALKILKGINREKFYALKIESVNDPYLRIVNFIENN